MKFFTALLRLCVPPRAVARRRAEPDPADMGTAFGLDSTITLLGPPRRPEAGEPRDGATPRLARRRR